MTRQIHLLIRVLALIQLSHIVEELKKLLLLLGAKLDTGRAALKDVHYRNGQLFQILALDRLIRVKITGENGVDVFRFVFTTLDREGIITFLILFFLQAAARDG